MADAESDEEQRCQPSVTQPTAFSYGCIGGSVLNHVVRSFRFLHGPAAFSAWLALQVAIRPYHTVPKDSFVY